jgi:hypothetical protein
MLYDPESLFRLARQSQVRAAARARQERELSVAGIRTGPRAAVAASLRALADRLDDRPRRVRERQPAG